MDFITSYNKLQNNRLMLMNEVCNTTGLTEATIKRLIDLDAFPAGVEMAGIEPKIWLRSSIQNWAVTQHLQ